MNWNTAKRIVYGVSGGLHILTTLLILLSVMTMEIFTFPFLETTGEESPKASFSWDIFTFSIPGILLMVIAVRQSDLLKAPSKSKYIFPITAALICVRLLLDALNQAQGFHAGHAIMIASLTSVLHDYVLCQRRSLGLAEIKWN